MLRRVDGLFISSPLVRFFVPPHTHWQPHGAIYDDGDGLAWCKGDGQSERDESDYGREERRRGGPPAVLLSLDDVGQKRRAERQDTGRDVSW